MSTSSSELPDKPSALIKLALKDLRKAEEATLYEVQMGDWHTGYKELENAEGVSEEEPCEVCFAGAVIAFSLNAAKEAYIEPHDFPEEEGKLRSLDEFRTGNIHWGLREFYNDSDYKCRDIQDFLEIPHYHDSKEGFHERMGELAELLEEKGY